MYSHGLWRKCYFFLLFLTTYVHAQWTQLNGPLVTINSFAVSGQFIYEGTLGDGIYLSSDNGSTWFNSNSGLTNKTIWCMSSLQSASKNYVFAGTIGSGVFVSTNNGASWSTYNNSISQKSIWSLTSVVTSTGENRIYAGTGGDGVFVSKDNGMTWEQINNGLGDLYVLSLTVYKEALFAGTGSGVYKYTNGLNWSAVNSGLSNIYVWAITSNDSYIFAGTKGSGVFKSSDCGNNWVVTNSGITNNSIWSLTSTGATIIAGTNEGGYFLSADNGQTWKLLNNNISNLSIKAIAAVGNDFFAGTDAGSWKCQIKDNTTGINKIESVPAMFNLMQNYPNPFNPSTHIEFELPKAGDVKLKIFNVLGEVIYSKYYSNFSQGRHSIIWEGTNESGRRAASGNYIYSVEYNGIIKSKKMILLK
jgi:hypothetical protein